MHQNFQFSFIYCVLKLQKLTIMLVLFKFSIFPSFYIAKKTRKIWPRNNGEYLSDDSVLSCQHRCKIMKEALL